MTHGSLLKAVYSVEEMISVGPSRQRLTGQPSAADMTSVIICRSIAFLSTPRLWCDE